jgi:hypothetical protein
VKPAAFLPPLLAALVLVGMVLPAQAAAHGRSATVALDYRLEVDSATRALPGVHVRVLDGDRDFQLKADRGVRLLVRGALGEPLIRIDSSGVWVNASSPTATGDKIVSSSKRGWIRVSGSRAIVWHDHRLSPPPTSKVGVAGSFSIPIEVNGHKAAIGGTFIRVARPSGWPWPAAAAVLAGGILVAVRRRSLRPLLTVGLGTIAGLAALAEVTTFAVRDAPTGGVAWLQIGTAVVIGAVLGTLLVRLSGRSRAHAAGVVGAVAAAVSLSSLPVYWHGVVISALAPDLARAVCEIALVFGVGAAALSFLPDFDEPVRGARAVKAPRVRAHGAKGRP